MARAPFTHGHMKIIASVIQTEVDLIGSQRAAGALNQQTALARLSTARRIALSFIAAFAQDNPRFRAEVFLRACGFGSDTVSQTQRRSP